MEFHPGVVSSNHLLNFAESTQTKLPKKRHENCAEEALHYVYFYNFYDVEVFMNTQIWGCYTAQKGTYKNINSDATPAP